MSLHTIDINSFIVGLYVTPQELIDNPKPTEFEVGDIVEIQVGPAKGKLGTIAVPRNGNYKDYEPYVSEESIGVLVVKTNSHSDQSIQELIELFGGDKKIKTEVRWFDSANELKFFSKMSQIDLDNNSSQLN